MPWNKAKCQWGFPENFKAEDAIKAVNTADFSKAVYVDISEEEENTKNAFTFYDVDGYRICVVGHTHYNKWKRIYDEPANCYIPGFQNWQMKTPSHQIKVISALKTGGKFPGNNRYPHKN